MEISADISLPSAEAERRELAQGRLYVLFQSAGWGAVLALCLWLTIAFPEPQPGRTLLSELAIVVMYEAIGLLITHFIRPLMTHWKWKQLGWRPLLLRTAAMAVVASGVWVGLSTFIVHGVLGFPWGTEHRASLMLLLDWLDCAIVIAAWLGLYYFYHLFDRLNRSEIERFQLMTSVKEAELRALKSQVNPHFIFNSLNSLRALIDEDPDRARQAVTQLANLLRYSLKSGQSETVPFGDELDVVNDYLALEQVRHEERLRLRLDIAPEALALPVPPMLLQTLVENAVKYGISSRPEGGEIAIVARNEGGALRIQVWNPGMISADAPVRSTGLGLRNAAERLRLIFGERASLQLRSERAERVVAEAVIPLPAHS